MKKQNGEVTIAAIWFLLGIGFSGLIWSNEAAKDAETVQADQSAAIVAQK